MDASGMKHRIRLAGIDAPEKNQPYGDVSTQGLIELVSGKTVTIEYKKRDRYERIVGKVLVNPPGDVFCMALDCVKKIDAGLEQIKARLAWHLPFFIRNSLEGRGAKSIIRHLRASFFLKQSIQHPWE